MNARKKIKAIIWPLIYLVLIIGVCISSAMVFHSYYYTAIYVSGSSMDPTLSGSGEMVDYGIIDTHRYAIDNMIKSKATRDRNRFKIVTTYYPFSGSSDYVGGYSPNKENVVDENNASYKIKRIYAFPGECFKFEADTVHNTVNFYVKDSEVLPWPETPVTIKFNRNIDLTRHNYNYVHNTPLGENEFWVMGDNYKVSYDCFSTGKPIYYDNIVGVLVAIEGRCKISKTNTGEDGTHVTATCTDRQKYSWPKYF